MEHTQCPCGKTVMTSLYLRHIKSKVHITFLEKGKIYTSQIDERYDVGDWRRYRASKMRCLNNYFKRRRQNCVLRTDDVGCPCPK